MGVGVGGCGSTGDFQQGSSIQALQLAWPAPEPLSSWFCQKLGDFVWLVDWVLSSCSTSRKCLKPQKQAKLCSPFSVQRSGTQSGIGVHCSDRSQLPMVSRGQAEARRERGPLSLEDWRNQIQEQKLLAQWRFLKSGQEAKIRPRETVNKYYDFHFAKDERETLSLEVGSITREREKKDVTVLTVQC